MKQIILHQNNERVSRDCFRNYEAIFRTIIRSVVNIGFIYRECDSNRIYFVVDVISFALW